MHYYTRIRKQGFTLIELLIVISIIGILAGVVISVIDPNAKKHEAQDAVKRSTLEKLAESIESYSALEGLYPVAGENKPDDETFYTTYVKNVWPNGTPEGAVYIYIVNETRTEFAVYVVSSEDIDKAFKYSSLWSEIKECNTLAVDGGEFDTCL